MENSNQENNVHEQKEFLEKLHNMIESAPKGIQCLVFADGDCEKDKQMIVVGAKGKPADISFMLAAAIANDTTIEKIISAANFANKAMPPFMLNMLRRRF